MKITASKSKLARGLARAQGAIAKKPQLPILSNVLIEANGDRLRIVGSDLDVTVDGYVDARVENPGRVTVDGKKLYDIVRSLPGEEVSMAVDDALKVDIKSRSSAFTLNGLPAVDYPQVPDTDGVALAKVDGEALRELIERTSFSIATDESRPNLTGAFVQTIADGSLRFVSTDGHRLSCGTRNALNGELTIDGVIVPRKGIAEVKRVLDESLADVSIGVLHNNLIVDTPDSRLMVRLIDAAYPDYQQVIPKSSKCAVFVNRVDMLKTLKRLIIVASDRASGVKIDISESSMVLGSNSQDIGSATEELTPDQYDGEDMTICINARYMIDVLSALSADTVSISLNEETSPCVVRESGSNDYMFVVMPMRL